jgi:sugar phosphate isomerase/epimerase
MTKEERQDSLEILVRAIEIANKFGPVILETQTTSEAQRPPQ